MQRRGAYPQGLGLNSKLTPQRYTRPHYYGVAFTHVFVCVCSMYDDVTSSWHTHSQKSAHSAHLQGIHSQKSDDVT